MKKPLKIAIYSGEIPSTTFIERLISGISESGHRVLLFGILNQKPKHASVVTVVAYKLNRFSKLWHLVYYSILLTLFKGSAKKRLDAYLKQQQKTDLYTKVKYYPVLWYQPDVFHLQWAKGLDDWLWVQDFGIQLVLSLRGAHINYSPIADKALADMYRLNFPKVDGFHAVSEAIGAEAQKYGADAQRIQVVYSGLRLNGQRSIETESIENKTVFKMISVGRSHWKKGYTYALDACKHLMDAGFLFEYTIIGGANAIEYQYQIYELGLENHVKLIGQQPYETVQNHIQDADLLILPSIEEGIANVVLEAMALGTLVLSTNCGGMCEVLSDGETGFLVPIRNSKALADTVLRIYNLSEEERLMIRERGRLKILEQHSEEQMVRGILGIYNSLYCR